MLDGKKGTAQTIVYEAFEQVKKEEQDKLIAWGEKNCDGSYKDALATIEQIVSDRKDLRTRSYLLDEAIIRGIEFTNVPTKTEKVIEALANRWFCFYGDSRSFAPFSLRLAGGGRLDRPLFGGERIHLGAYEAALLAHARLRRRTELFLQGSGGFLVYQAPRDPFGDALDPRDLLHLQRGGGQVPRLAQHRHFLCLGRGGVYL